MVLRSDPRPRSAEEAVLLTSEGSKILMGASGPDPETGEECDKEQRADHPQEQNLRSRGFVAGGFDIRLFSLVLHTASPASPLRPTSRAVDRA